MPQISTQLSFQFYDDFYFDIANEHIVIHGVTGNKKQLMLICLDDNTKPLEVPIASPPSSRTLKQNENDPILIKEEEDDDEDGDCVILSVRKRRNFTISVD
jgi:hypothetical protein